MPFGRLAGGIDITGFNCLEDGLVELVVFLVAQLVVQQRVFHADQALADLLQVFGGMPLGRQPGGRHFDGQHQFQDMAQILVIFRFQHRHAKSILVKVGVDKHPAALLASQGLDACMVPFHVPTEGLAALVSALRGLRNLGGLVVTVPHKENAAVQYELDRINAAGGWNGQPVELVEFDNQGGPVGASDRFRVAVADGVQTIVQGASSAISGQLTEDVRKHNLRNPGKGHRPG